MKQRSIILTALLIMFVVVGCRIPKEFISQAGLKATPNPLELKGGMIECNVEGTFPEKYFHKKMELSVVPVLKSTKTGAVLRGQAKVYQGEKFKGNNPVINYKKGGKYEQKAVFSYDPQFDQCELYLEATVRVKKKVINLEPVKVADGLIVTPNLIYSNPSELGSKVIKDNFQRVTEEKENAEIKFLIQQANVRASEAKNINALTDNIKKSGNDSSSVKMEVASYASPDGGVELNEKLAQARETSTKNYINSQMKKLKKQIDISGTFTAQDWEGFKQLMDNSDIQDKELILNVLSMYSDPEQREKEIKNLSAAFTEIKEKILPQLRRSKITVTREVMGKSDEQIARLVKEDPSKLSAEELLYAATLTQDKEEQKEIYRKTIQYFPSDVRGYNNLGVVEYELGNVKEADRNFTKALEIDPNNPVANLNKGSVLLAEGSLGEAKTYLGNAAGAGDELNYANGAIAIAEGDYYKAVTLYGAANTNNSALARILNKDYSGARNILANVENPDAKTYYLQAIVAARTNNVDDLVKSATKAINVDGSYKEKFMNDLEFKSFLSNEAFSALVK